MVVVAEEGMRDATTTTCPRPSMRALRLLTPARSLPSKPCRISRNLFSSSSSPPASENNEAETDTDDVIPRKPTWSVHELISSYPRPHISDATLKKLHQLSALVPPTEGTPEHERIRRELEEMVRLVEAVKLVDTSSVDDANEIPDGRIWPEGCGDGTDEQWCREGIRRRR